MLNALTTIRNFIAVAENGSVHEAARKMNISQSALTRQIQSIEDEVGVQMFDRTARGMELNGFGQTFVYYARQMELNARHAHEELANMFNGGTGHLRVGAGPAWSYSIIPDAIARLHETMPGVTVELVTQINDYYSLLESGHIDLLLAEFPEEAQRLPDLEYQHIMTIDRFIFARRDHPLMAKTPLLHSDLLDYPWVRFLGSPMGEKALRHFFEGSGLPFRRTSVATTSFQAGFRLLQKHNYLMMLPATIKTILHDLGIDILPIGHHPISYAAGLIYRTDVQRLRHFREFSSHLIDIAKQVNP